MGRIRIGLGAAAALLAFAAFDGVALAAPSGPESKAACAWRNTSPADRAAIESGPLTSPLPSPDGAALAKTCGLPLDDDRSAALTTLVATSRRLMGNAAGRLKTEYGLGDADLDALWAETPPDVRSELARLRRAVTDKTASIDALLAEIARRHGLTTDAGRVLVAQYLVGRSVWANIDGQLGADSVPIGWDFQPPAQNPQAAACIVGHLTPAIRATLAAGNPLDSRLEALPAGDRELLAKDCGLNIVFGGKDVLLFQEIIGSQKQIMVSATHLQTEYGVGPEALDRAWRGLPPATRRLFIDTPREDGRLMPPSEADRAAVIDAATGLGLADGPPRNLFVDYLLGRGRWAKISGQP